MVSTFRNGAAVALLLGASIAVHAAGLGKLTVNSALGQVLNAEIDLVSLQPGELDSLSARVAAPEAFRDARIEYTPPLRLLRFSVEKRPNGQPYLKVTSIAPINEPFVDALIEVSWPAGRIQREYPILLDPPGYSETRPPAVAAAAPAAAPAAETPPAATPAAAPSTPAAAAAEPTGSPSAQAEMAAGKGEATQAAASDTYGPVEKGETLSKIAGQVKPGDVTLEQMLVAMYRQNQDAFSGNNMNRLKTGQILKVPTADEVAQITPTEAGKEIRTQVADWNKYREQLAGGVASIPSRPESTNVAKGSVSPAAVIPPPAPADQSSDTLRLSKSQSGKGGSAKGSSQDRLNALQEEVTSKDKALKEAQSRVADLEKQIREMQRLLDLKAAVPGKAGETKVATAETPPKPAEPVKAAEAKPEKPAEAAKPPEVPAATETPKPAEAAPPPPKTPPPKVAEKPKAPAKLPPPPPPKSLMDELMDNPAYLAAGVGAVALLGVGGFMFVRRRRGRGDGGPDSAMTSAFPSDLKPGAASTGKPAGGLVDTGNSSFLTDFDKTGPGTIDTDEVDPVAEAEVYIAYGRDAQAEEILKEAMARDKGRHEIALKLLEIYHARKSATAFETVAKELRAAVGDSHPLWQKAAAMGAQIDPTNPLYVAAAGGTATFTAMSSPAPAASAPPKPDLDFDLDTNASSGAQIADTGAGSPTPSFDLDLDAQKPAAHAPDLPVGSSSGMDFDLAPSAPAAHPDVHADAKNEKPAFDFDLSGLDFPASKSAEAPRAPAPAPSGGGLEMADLSLDAPGGQGGAEAIGTKLELAKAYLEIGDKDGAREILHEVAKEGSSAQQEEAKKLIASL